jgi:hypothetical protein
MKNWLFYPLKFDFMYIQNLQSSSADDKSYLNIIADQVAKLTFKVVDVRGMIAKKMTTEVPEGNHQLDLQLGELATGNYIINAFMGDTFIKSIRFQKQ